MDKDQTIERIYTDPAGFGSLKETLKEANKIDPTITIKDIKEWIEKIPIEEITYQDIIPTLPLDQNTNIRSTCFS